MSPKIAGCCSKCDTEVYAVKVRDAQTGRPKQLGAALEHAERATFVLVNGSRMDLTFCSDCANALAPVDFAWLWQRVMVSWIAESPGHDWPKTQTENGIVGLLAVKPWKEIPA